MVLPDRGQFGVLVRCHAEQISCHTSHICMVALQCGAVDESIVLRVSLP